MSAIRKQVEHLVKTAEGIDRKIAELQDKCKHPKAAKEYRADTGNYDPSQDSYWIEWDCPECKKRWTTDQ